MLRLYHLSLLFLQQFLATIVITMLAAFGFVNPQIADQYWGLNPTVFMFVYMGIYIVMMGAPMWFAASCFRMQRNPFGMHARVRPAVFVATIFLGLAGCTLANLVTNTWINVWSFFGIELQNIDLYVQPNVLSLLLNLFTFALLPALLEEMVFRGFVLQGLRGLGEPAAILLSSLLFGLMHTNMLQLPFAFLVGLVLGFLTVKTGNIWVAITIHFLNNGISVVMEYVGLFVDEATIGRLTTLVFAVLSVIGIVTMAVLFVQRSSLITIPELPRTALLPRQRLRAVMGAPCLWISIAAFAAMTLFVTLLDAVAAALA